MAFLVPRFFSSLVLLLSWIPSFQCDQTGQFLKVVGDKFSSKSSPNTWERFGLLENKFFIVKDSYGFFLGHLLETFGILFFRIKGKLSSSLGIEPWLALMMSDYEQSHRPLGYSAAPR